MLPKHGHGITDDTREARYLRAFKEDLPPEHVSLFYAFLSRRIL